MTPRVITDVRILAALIFVSLPLAAQRAEHWALILDDPPLAAQTTSRKQLAALADREVMLESRQSLVRQSLQSRRIPVTGAMRTLLNAVFVTATREEIAELRKLPGVAWIAPMPAMKRHMNKANDLISAPAAWNVLGGAGSAGAGVKIGVLDTGIDHTHPAFQDSSLSPPAGFPKCAGDDCAYTNNKIIVARSYVLPLALGNGTPDDSRPDDLSPRDRVGHGTAVAMAAAGVPNQGPAAGITGVAPKAFLGNYKIFGSPGVNDVTFSNVLLQALNDAFNDGMDVVTLNFGLPATWSLADRGAVCGRAANEPCDPWADAVENASRNGMAVTVSAGNDGELGLNTIHTPGSAPGAITVSASRNSHRFFSTVRLSNGQEIDTLFSDGPRPAGVFQAAMRDVAAINNNGRACEPLGNNTLTGRIALIEQGDCSFSVKVIHAERAGAVAVVLYRPSGSNTLFTPSGLAGTGIPSSLIGSDAAGSLKSHLQANPDAPVTLDPALTEVAADDSDAVALFASQGPNLNDNGLKPDVTAVGQGVYTATQNYDPNGDLYSPDRYASVSGTSFSAPMAAGAVALVKQRNPSYSGPQLKSAVVNTAKPGLKDIGSNGEFFPARVTAVGTGLVDAGNAVRATITADPASISFGVVPATTFPSRGVRITNNGAAATNIRLVIQQRDADSRARVVVSPDNFSLNPGQSMLVTARLEGSRPNPGAYEGFIQVEGSPVPMDIPYLYLVGDGVPANLVVLTGSNWVQDINGRVLLTFKAVDQFGVPVGGLLHQFQPPGLVVTATRATDGLGIGEAVMLVPPQLGAVSFAVDAGGFRQFFDGRSRLSPVISTNGVTNAGSFQLGSGLSAGSYATIKGSNLAEATRVFGTPYLPISLAGVSVSFDAPSRNLSLPGRIHFVSPEQINVQIPWEFEGLTSVLMKVAIGNSQTALFTLTLADYGPGFFEYLEPSSGRLLAAARDEANILVSSDNPVARGTVVQFFVNGLGPVNDRPASGEPSAVAPLSHTRATPQVTIGGQQATIQFSGLTPFIVGLYQVNAVVPAGIGTGLQEATLSIGGATAKSTLVPVK